MAELPKYFYFRVRPVIVKGSLTEIQLEDASDADVVEVVRCRDCKHVEYCLSSGGENFFCAHGEN